MNGQTIQQLAQHPSQSLWAFLTALPQSLEAQILYALIASGVIGMFAHYFMSWIKGEITGSLFEYLFVHYPRQTMLAFTGIIAAALTAIMSGVFTTSSGEFVGWLNVLWIGLTSGYASDSIANKGTKKEVTPEPAAPGFDASQNK